MQDLPDYLPALMPVIFKTVSGCRWPILRR
jgi:hypothetical protein